MLINYALIVTTICSLILLVFPKLLSADEKPIRKRKTIGYTLLSYVILYLLAPTPFLFPICVLLSIVLGVLICLMVYWQVTNFIIKRSPSLAKKFQSIDKMSGFEFEEYVGEILTAKGYRDVTLTKKTGDYGVDATCYPVSPKDKRKIAIQIKRYNTPVSVGAVQEIVAGATVYKADLKMVITNSTFTSNAKILAEHNDCILIDRLNLQNWVYEVEKAANRPKKKLKFKKNIAPVAATPALIANEAVNPTNNELFDDLYLETELDELLLDDQTKHLSVELITTPMVFAVEEAKTTFNEITDKKDDLKSTSTNSKEEATATQTDTEITESENAVESNTNKETTENETKAEEDSKENPQENPKNTELEPVIESTATKNSESTKKDAKTDSSIDDELGVNSDEMEEDIPIPIEGLDDGIPIEDELDGIGIESTSIDEFEVPDL